jgi:magnesium transporter
MTGKMAETAAVEAPEGEPLGARFRIVELDFKTKKETEYPISDVRARLDAGAAIWIDIEVTEPDLARGTLRKLGLIDDDIIEDALHKEPSTRLARFENYLHLVVSGCRPRGGAFDLERVDVIIGERLVITLHRGPILFLSQVLRDYRADFRRFAQSMSFLVYEIWDNLIENYLSVQKVMEERVDHLQTELRKENVADDVFSRLSELGADLLHFRKILLPARAVLTELSTRKTIFLSEATQPFLGNMVGTVEHVLQDLLVDREVLTDSLNLYMSIVSHRTNEVMKRLTVVSIIFLPLTFLCGVYGMNFDVMPELRWHVGYGMFWVTALTIVLGLLWLMRRNRLL